MNDVITARQRAVNRHVTHGRWRLPWSLDSTMYCRSLRTFDAQRCTVGSQLPQVIPGKLRTSRQGLRTTFSWVFWGFNGEYNMILSCHINSNALYWSQHYRKVAKLRGKSLGLLGIRNFPYDPVSLL